MLAATPPVVLAIAAHDPLGGAGLAADLTTFAAFGVHGTVAVTAVTAQHLRSVDRVEPMDSGLVADQIDAIADTFPIAGVKTGLLGSAAIVEVVAAPEEEKLSFVEVEVSSDELARVSYA
ncbi:MAG: bifunctional hydroxymethylpyrimidine kinase/phosphomethylpyrimidine kinase, partial [Acidimicrobiales bacterium]